MLNRVDTENMPTLRSLHTSQSTVVLFGRSGGFIFAQNHCLGERVSVNAHQDQR